MTARWIKMTLGIAALCCGPKLQPPSPAPGRCQSEPAAIPARALPELESRVGVRLSVSPARLLEELSKHVPQTLARERNQSIGAAGRVSFSVIRGPLRAKLLPEGLQISTELRGDIDVCKPLGPFCARYGTCQPRWLAQVTVPTDFARDPSLRAVTSVELSTGCVLSPVGYDATAELKRITQSETRKVRQRIHGELRKAEERIAQAWSELHKPFKINPEQCLRVEPSTVHYATPREEAGLWTSGLELRGHLSESCEAAPAEPAQVVSVPELAPQVALRAALPWPVDALQLALQTALKKPVTLRIVAGLAPADANRLFVGLPGAENCTEWVAIMPEIAGATLRLRPAESSALPSALSQALNNSAVPLPEQAESLQSDLTRLSGALTQASEELKQHHIVLERHTESGFDAEIDQHGLRLVARVDGTLHAVAASDQ